MLNKVLVSFSLVLLLAVSNASAGEANKVATPKASTSEVDALIGTYSAKYYGEQLDRYRVEKHEKSFWLMEKKITTTGPQWERIHSKKAAKVINKKLFEKMMKKTVDGPAVGLNFSDRVVIFKAKKGFTIGKMKMPTGYFVFFDGIFLDLKKENENNPIAGT